MNSILLIEIINERDNIIESLRYQLNNALQYRFGRKSEKDSNDAQLSLLDEAVLPDHIAEIIEADEIIFVLADQRKNQDVNPYRRICLEYKNSMT